jgi:HlyD family secretion protein
VSRNVDKEAKALERNKRSGKAKKLPKGETAAAAEVTEDDEETTDKRVDGVYVMRDGRAEFVPVHTGISDDRFVEVESGLVAGDKVLTGPYQTLRTMESGKRVMEKKDSKADGKDKK